MNLFKAFNYLSSRHTRDHLKLIHFCYLLSPPPNRFASFRLYSASKTSTFMEVFKAIVRQGSTFENSFAILADEKCYSYQEIILSARRISTLLSNEDLKSVKNDGVQKTGCLDGVRVGIVAKPSAEFVSAVLGTWFSGCVAVPLALSYPETELLHVMKDSDVSIILSTEDHSDAMKAVATKSEAQLSIIPPVSHSENRKLDNNSSLQESDFLKKIQGDVAALILYTSGTTGKPKGVVHTHQSILAQVQMLTEAWGYTSSDQFLHCLPVSGIWQRWRDSYPKDGSKADNAVTVFTGVPTMYTRLIQGYEAMDPDMQFTSASAASRLRLMMCGSSALPYPVMQQWEMITGHRLLERYGMTEFVMAISNPLHGLRKGGTVGKPFPGVEVKILPEDGSGNDSSGVGELCVKSPSSFREYWKLPEVTKESFIDGGFFRTGDAVKVDEDGYYHPVISECCVLGLPDKTYGEVVCAIIVPHEDARKQKQQDLQPALTLEELRGWAKDRLAPYKLPTRLHLWESLPRNAMGKVNKKDLKKQLATDE
ncbi:hypothetical protein V2J09_010914 [Rumex salicifolius]